MLVTVAQAASAHLDNRQPLHMNSGFLTSKNGCIISLTLEDLSNYHFAIFHTNCTAAVELFLPQRCSSRLMGVGMGLVLGLSWTFVLIYGVILFCPTIIMYCEVCCCLHIN